MKSTIVTVHEAKTHLSRLIQRVLKGESVIIAKGKKPVVQLKVIGNFRAVRRTGDLKGLIEMADDFNAPMDDFSEYR
jgi:antitoxin (DNA-binding transcriptional repressor) of toxin-antitoxin stability system